jgi:hypothetical protein
MLYASHGTCRHYVKEAQETLVKQVELFLNSVPLLSPLSRDDKLLLLDAMEEQQFAPGSKVQPRKHTARDTFSTVAVTN